MNQNSHTCADIRSCFSDYLDGAINGHTMRRVSDHLCECAACTREFAAWRTVQDSLAILRKPAVPPNLGLKLRLAISHERARQSARFLDTLSDAVSLRWDNAIRPFVMQVSAGFAMTVALLGTVGLLLGSVAAPQAVLANDEPLAAISTPRYLYSAERSRPIITGRDATIVVEADVNAEGRVFDYTIISGPQDSLVRNQIQDRLLLSVFEPARVFGSPVRGRVVVTYSGVSVHA